MIDTCKNITLPQTSFVDGKNQLSKFRYSKLGIGIDYRSDLYSEETEVFHTSTRILMTFFTQQEMATGLGGQRAFAQKLNK